MTFVVDLQKFAERAKGNIDKVVRKVVIDVGTSVVLKSPVGDATLWSSPAPKGYVGGRFRANWQYGFETPPVVELPDIDPTGARPIAKIVAGVGASPVAGKHYVVNNLPYAKRLEDGWSKQAPQGMVTLTLIEFTKMVNDSIRSIR